METVNTRCVVDGRSYLPTLGRRVGRRQLLPAAAAAVTAANTRAHLLAIYPNTNVTVESLIVCIFEDKLSHLQGGQWGF